MSESTCVGRPWLKRSRPADSSKYSLPSRKSRFAFIASRCRRGLTTRRPAHETADRRTPRTAFTTPPGRSARRSGSRTRFAPRARLAVVPAPSAPHPAVPGRSTSARPCRSGSGPAYAPPGAPRCSGSRSRRSYRSPAGENVKNGPPAPMPTASCARRPDTDHSLLQIPRILSYTQFYALFDDTPCFMIGASRWPRWVLFLRATSKPGSRQAPPGEVLLSLGW